jgi:hypothetical protein
MNFMKRTIWFILFFGLVNNFPILIASGKSEKNENFAKGFQIRNTQTNKMSQFIEVDSFMLQIVPPATGVQFYKDGIIFISSSKSEGNMLPGHISFGTTNAMFAVLNDGVLENPQLFSPSVNFTYPTEAFTFSTDFKTLYFTKISENDGIEKIYEAKFTQVSGNQGDWTVDENPMSFCSGQSIYTHPALSADGKTMIFASDCPGSVGGTDLFMTQNIKGTWSVPVNIGDAVNTRSNELYPYLDSENNLFFSSDGIQGFGGYDIFVCKYNRGTWEKPINLSTPINTSNDDVAFTINRKNGRSAFYTVKQKSGTRSTQLYMVTTKNYSGPENFSSLSQIFTNPKISHMVILVAEQPVQATDRKDETLKPRISGSRGEKDNIVYRVQFLTSFNPRTRSQISVNGTDHSVFEYLYAGAYRLCVGEFSTLPPAIELENSLKQSDYPLAFVVAFRNNFRTLDPELLKRPPVSGPVAATVEKKVTSEPETKVKPAETKVETKKEVIPVPETTKVTAAKTIPTTATTTKTTTTAESGVKKDVVIYRVQILASPTRKGSYKITVNGRSYNTFEYLYSGAYRTCIGDFSTLAPAKEFQNTLRKSGYSQAFAVAFKNNVRSLDPALFK